MIEFKPVTQEEIATFAKIHYQCWMETYPGLIPQHYLDNLSLEKNIDKFTKLYDVIGPYLFLVYDDGKPVGIFDITPARDQVEDCQTEVQGLYLLKKCHGKGIGKSILTYVKQVLQARNEHAFYLWCLSTNPTVGFYQHLGGVETQHRKIDFAGENLDEAMFIFRF